MLVNKNINGICRLFLLVVGIALLGACGSDSDEDSESFVKFYNASYNAPSIYMTLDEDIDNDYDDEFEATFSAVAYASAGSRISLNPRDYFLELAWQSEDSSTRSDIVLFTSDEINYAFGGQHLIAIRENFGSGGSPFIIDNMTNTQVTEYSALESRANISIYNGLDKNPLVPEYEATINAEIIGISDIPIISELGYGSFSDVYQVDSGDYRFKVENAATQSSFLQNSVLSLPQNTNRSLFLYWTEEEVDDDNDGNVDENDDGIVDEIRPIVSSLVVDNSERFRLYDKELTLLNLVNTDEFSLVKFYFVKSDEIIETATNTRNLTKGFASSIILLNNT